jgi:hypothetical protein
MQKSKEWHMTPGQRNANVHYGSWHLWVPIKSASIEQTSKHCSSIPKWLALVRLDYRLGRCTPDSPPWQGGDAKLAKQTATPFLTDCSRWKFCQLHSPPKKNPLNL